MDRTLIKGLTLLEVLARGNGPRGVTELAEQLRLGKSNVHRTLKTLAAAGFVHQMPGSSDYDCTFKMLELGCKISSRLDLATLADLHMAELLRQTGETVHLSVLDAGDVAYLHKLDSPQPVRAYSAIGGRAPAYCVATGKALLAYTDDLYARYPSGLVRHTPRTITDLAKLAKELKAVRAHGYAVNRGEWRQTVHGIAAPIYDATCKPVAAVGISGPANRLPDRLTKTLAGSVVSAAEAISTRLGYRS